MTSRRKTSSSSQRGFTLLELMCGMVVFGLLSVLLVGLHASQLKILQTTRHRAEIVAETDRTVGVVESWMNWSTRTDLLASRSSSTGSDTGQVLRLDLGALGVGWVTLTSGGLNLESPDGTLVQLSSRLRPPPSGIIFERSVPTSPWDDQQPGGGLAYDSPFARSGMVVMNYCVAGDPTVRQRGFAILGL